MKKIFTLIAVAAMAMVVNAQTKLIDFPASTTGIAAVDGGTAVLNGKVSANGTEYNPTIQFKNSGANNGVELTTNGGFKAGDVVTLAVIISNSDESKKGQVEIHGSEKLYTTTEGFNAALAPTKDPVSESYTLTEDVEKLVLARSGNTVTHITALTVTRGGGSADGVETWDAAGLAFDEKTKTILDVVKTENTNGSYIIPSSIKQFPEGTYPDNIAEVIAWLDQQDDASIYALPLNDYVFTASTANVSLKAVSTPNATENDKPDVECWQSNGGAETNVALNTDECPIKWTNYVKAKNGNPSLGYYNYYDTNADGDPVNRVSDALWSIGCGKAPGKGSYFEFTFKKAGAMVMGVFLNRPNQSNVVVIDKETLAPLAYTDLSFKGFCLNNTVKYPDNSEESTDPTFQAFQFREDYTINVEANPSRALLGYLSFPVEAKTYLVFQPSSQLGIYGFQFTAGGTTDGVETIKTTNNVWNANAPMYNLAGQKVDSSYKGIVIQNGRKFYNK